MPFEIEAKARIKKSERSRIEEHLNRLGTPLGRFHKKDCYWAPVTGEKESDRLVRMRFLKPDKIDAPAVITRKEKSFHGTVEINREVEFSVDQASSFSQFLSSLGFYPWMEKEKIGSAWNLDEALVEICQVTGLGLFLEIEIVISDEARESEKVKAARKIEAIFTSFGINKDAMEKRYYLEMLREK
jgi:adenylate cyclase, class 2